MSLLPDSDPFESPERAAARAGKSAGMSGMFGGVRKYQPGGCLGRNTVIGMLALIAGLTIFVSVTKQIPILPRAKAASIEESIQSFLPKHRLEIESGRISYAGATVLFIGPKNAYEESDRQVEPVAGVELVNGTFGDFGAAWCVAIDRSGTVTVTTNAGPQPAAQLCGPKGQPLLP
ncbi:MAG: hypothetical protein EB027_01990 [Actinobacteria bacterium]|nr:hypothetical protein [Actinomycetota bacterium]